MDDVAKKKRWFFKQDRVLEENREERFDPHWQNQVRHPHDIYRTVSQSLDNSLLAISSPCNMHDLKKNHIMNTEAIVNVGTQPSITRQG